MDDKITVGQLLEEMKAIVATPQKPIDRRTYLAGQIASGIFANENTEIVSKEASPENKNSPFTRMVAVWSVNIADALVAELDKDNQPKGETE